MKMLKGIYGKKKKKMGYASSSYMGEVNFTNLRSFSSFLIN